MFGGGTVPGTAPMPGMVRGPINTWNEGNAHGVVLAIDPMTGDRKWGFPMHDVATSGVLTTASNLLFVGGREGFFQALDARTGKLLWKAIVGAETAAGPMTYAVDGKQYIAIAGGHTLFVFGLD
jgi:glucose dehydrogenase